MQRSYSKIIIITLILLILPLQSHAAPKFLITNWKEVTNLNESGKISKVWIKGKTQDVKKNQIVTSFSIGFDQKQNIKINKVTSDGKIAKYSFSNNLLKITLPNTKGNHDPIAINLVYQEKYSHIYRFLRQEAINIPSFAAGANAHITIKFPHDMESATLNPNVIKNGNSFIYTNIVPKDGVQEIIKLTASRAVWDINIKTIIKSDRSIEKLIVTLPTYFQNSNQTIYNYTLNSNPHPIKQSEQKKKQILNFKTKEKEIIIENKAKIITGKNSRGYISRHPSHYLNINDENRDLLTPILHQIKQIPNPHNLPLYARIGNFVHQYIEYDKKYIGKLPKINEILQDKIGVCTEYALLYQSLTRLAGIPALIINGSACGEYDECQGHAWNLIFYNNKWIEVDPTWNLMSGIVSSSHIYFNDDGEGTVQTKYFNKKLKINSQIDFDMQQVL